MRESSKSIPVSGGKFGKGLETRWETLCECVCGCKTFYCIYGVGGYEMRGSRHKTAETLAARREEPIELRSLHLVCVGHSHLSRVVISQFERDRNHLKERSETIIQTYST